MFEICKLSAPNLNSIWDIQNYSEIFGDLMFVNSENWKFKDYIRWIYLKKTFSNYIIKIFNAQN